MASLMPSCRDSLGQTAVKNFPVQKAKPTNAAQYDQLVHGRLSGPFLKEYFVFKTFDPGDIFRRKSV